MVILFYCLQGDFIRVTTMRIIMSDDDEWWGYQQSTTCTGFPFPVVVAPRSCSVYPAVMLHAGGNSYRSVCYWCSWRAPRQPSETKCSLISSLRNIAVIVAGLLFAVAPQSVGSRW